MDLRPRSERDACGKKPWAKGYEAHLPEIEPLTVVEDPFEGRFFRAKFFAFNKKKEDLPDFSIAVDQVNYLTDPGTIVGISDFKDSAIIDLASQLFTIDYSESHPVIYHARAWLMETFKQCPRCGCKDVGIGFCKELQCSGNVADWIRGSNRHHFHVKCRACPMHTEMKILDRDLCWVYVKTDKEQPVVHKKPEVHFG